MRVACVSPSNLRHLSYESLLSTTQCWIQNRILVNCLDKMSGMGMETCQHCPHCHRTIPRKVPIEFENQATEIQLGKQNPEKSPSGRISLKEALLSVPCSNTPHGTSPTPLTAPSDRKPPSSHAKRPRIFSFASKWSKKGLAPNTATNPPERPKRPPIELCPPVRENRLAAPSKDYNCPTYYLSQGQRHSPNRKYSLAKDVQVLGLETDLELHCPQFRNIHHDLAYSLLTGQACTSLTGSASTPSSKIPDESTLSTRRIYPRSPSLGHLDSTNALIPTFRRLPLFSIKEDQDNEIPGVPITLPDFQSGIISYEDEKSYNITLDSNEMVGTKGSSGRSSISASVYSTDENISTLGPYDTTSRPLSYVLQDFRNANGSAKKDTETLAEEFRQELGNFDGIYDDQVDLSKRVRSETSINGAANVAECSSADKSGVRLGLFDAQQRHTEQSAQPKHQNSFELHAEQQQEHERWLRRLSNDKKCDKGNPTKSISLQSKGTRRPIVSNNFDIIRGKRAPGGPSRKNVPLFSTPDRPQEMYEFMHVVQGETTTENKYSCDSSRDCLGEQSNGLISEGSLVKLHSRLRELLEQDEEDGLPPKQSSSPLKGLVLPLPPPESHLGKSVDENGDVPLNLRRVEIEWRGRKYPVLIGDYTKVWEGPCLDPGCREHDQDIQGYWHAQHECYSIRVLVQIASWARSRCCHQLLTLPFS